MVAAKGCAVSVRVYPDAEELSREAAGLVQAELTAALEARPCAAFVLSGGRTPRLLYERLASKAVPGGPDWSRVHFFWGDERCVEPDSPESNYGNARQLLLSPLAIPEPNIHRIPAELAEPHGAARLYEKDIRDCFRRLDISGFDLTILGLGDDGHTASLFPGAEWDNRRWVVATEVPGRRVPRISMTPGLLNTSRCVAFLVSGSSKADALARAFSGEDERNAPAKRIRPASGRLIWLVDAPAASRLGTA